MTSHSLSQSTNSSRTCPLSRSAEFCILTEIWFEWPTARYFMHRSTRRRIFLIYLLLAAVIVLLPYRTLFLRQILSSWLFVLYLGVAIIILFLITVFSSCIYFPSYWTYSSVTQICFVLSRTLLLVCVWWKIINLFVLTPYTSMRWQLFLIL